MTTFLLYAGLAAAGVALIACQYDHDRMARNWSMVQAVILWLYFIVKG